MITIFHIIILGFSFAEKGIIYCRECNFYTNERLGNVNIRKPWKCTFPGGKSWVVLLNAL